MNEHYKQGDIECIDALKSCLTPEELQGAYKFNVIKYLWRWRHKGGLRDLEKALDYQQRLVELTRSLEEAEKP